MNKIRPTTIITIFSILLAIFLSSVSFAAEPSNIFYKKRFILLDKYNGYEGTMVNVRGYGFYPLEKVHIYLKDGKDDKGVHVTTTSFGNFTSSPTVIPNWKSGKYKMYAYGETSNNRASADFYIRGFSPRARPSKYYAHVGDTIGYSGTGFKPNAQIKLFHDNGDLISTFTSDSLGNFSVSNIFTVTPDMEDDNIKQYFVEPTTGKEVGFKITIAKELD